MVESPKSPKSHGDGRFSMEAFRGLGDGVVIESGVKVFHPENIELGARVYVGHDTILKAYYKNLMQIGAGTWIGQQCFFHSAGGLQIGADVGIGPGVKIITSTHRVEDPEAPILHAPLDFDAVEIADGADIGVGAIILPGTRLGRNVQVGAGAVVKGHFPDRVVIAGVPARIIKTR